MKVLLIDNYDSFTFNVKQYLLTLGYEVLCYRNDSLSILEISNLSVNAIVLSPGPKEPKSAGICLEVIRRFTGEIPIFGICLGHQCIAEAFGADIIHTKSLHHGKVSKIYSLNKGIMKNYKEFDATRYHSLAVDRGSLPSCLEITCETADGEIMGIKHRDYAIEGVQFHPESIMTEQGIDILKSFFDAFSNEDEKFKKSSPMDESYVQVGNSSLMEEPNANLKDLTIIQKTTDVTISLSFIELLEQFYHGYGKENICVFDSAAGPEIDCNNNIIGLFPKFDLVIANGSMEISTESEKINQLFKENFSNYYDPKTNKYNLNKQERFSSIFEKIKQMFILKKQHEVGFSLSHGLVGYFSYEYLHHLEDIPRENVNDLEFPDIHLSYYAHFIIENKETHAMQLVSNYIGEEVAREREAILQLLARKNISEEIHEETLSEMGELSSTVAKSDFIRNVYVAKEYILNGDIFQVQLGARKQIKSSLSSLQIYKSLRELNPSPYMFLWERGGCSLIGNSPELQLKVEKQEVLIRPIAGTSKGKGNNEEEQKRILANLCSSEKERAEHIMLVDLARNDIGIHALPDTVSVENLMEVSEFSHVFHLVSTVKGKFPSNYNTMALFEAAFPAGTLTGAPKVRAMEIIQELENYERGPYGGAFGFFDFNGDILSTIIIRTAIKLEDTIYFQSSAGVVADSVAKEEWNEIQLKSGAIKEVLGG